MTQLSENYEEPEPKPDLSRSKNFPRIAVYYLQHALVPIENTKNNFGFLLTMHYSNEENDTRLFNSNYIRFGKSPFKSYYENINISRHCSHCSLYISRTNTGVILPVASVFPYMICDLSEDEYIKLKGIIDSHALSRRTLDTVVDLFAKKEGFEKKRKGIIGLRRSTLITPEGYADQVRQWQGMPGRLIIA